MKEMPSYDLSHLGNLAMENSLVDLKAMEGRIQAALQPHTIDSVLCGLWNKAKMDGFLQPFMIAGTTQFALRFCAPTFGSMKPSPALDWQRLSAIVNLVTNYLLADPIGFDDTVPSSLLSIMLRIIGSQFPSASDLFGQSARSLILYHDTPLLLAGRKNIPRFDFADNFERVNGASVEDFVDISYIAFVAAMNRPDFSLDYFSKAQEEGMCLPEQSVIAAVLSKLSTDPRDFKMFYQKYKQESRQFAAYDYNPLFPFPIIRPWSGRKRTSKAQDRMIAPLPGLIPWRISTGVYYRMRDECRGFTEYFGHLFEAYAGEVLRYCTPGRGIVSEHDIRTFYSASKGKAPDWIVIEGDTAILVECKATYLKRLALVTGSESEIKLSLRQITGGIQQLHEFIVACQLGMVRHPALEGCKNYFPVVLTYEPLHLINSTIFRDFLKEVVEAEAKELPWLILSLDELERLQPHIAVTSAMLDIFSTMRKITFQEVLKDTQRQTGLTFKDSFLYEKEQEIYDRLGVPHEAARRAVIR